MQFRSIKFVKITSVMELKKSFLSLSCSEWQKHVPAFILFNFLNLKLVILIEASRNDFSRISGFFFCKPLLNCIPFNSHAQTLVLLARGNAQDGDREKEEQRKIKFP